MNGERRNKKWLGAAALLVALSAGWFLVRRGETRAEAKEEKPPGPSSGEPSTLEERARGPSREALLEQAAPRGQAASPELEERWEASDLVGLEAREAEAETPEQQARRLVLPVLQAIRNPSFEPEERRLRMLAALEASGPSSEPWTEDKRSVFSSWADALPAELDKSVDVDGARCYRAGCVVSVTFPNREAAERASLEFRKISEESATHGGRVQTPADFGAEGRLEASWIFLRPPR